MKTVRQSLLWFALSALIPAVADVLPEVEQDLVFSNLTMAVTQTVPELGTTYRRIVSYGESVVTFDGAGSLILTGGATEQMAAIDFHPVTSYGSGFVFNVPVTLVNDDAHGGVTFLYVGGCTFNRSVTLAQSTQPLSLRRVKGNGLVFSGSDCTADFASAASVAVGAPQTAFRGIGVTVEKGARLLLPDTVVAMGSTLRVARDSEVLAGDISLPDATYVNGEALVYSALNLQDYGRLRCRRLMTGATDGPKVMLGNNAVFTADDGVELHATNGAAMTVANCRVRTPDFNVRGTVAAQITRNPTFDVTALTTRVGRVTFDAGTGLSVTGRAGAVEFVAATSVPKLTLGVDVTLLFDDVTADRPPLEVGTLTLPKSDAVRLCVRNRMLTGRAVLATGFTDALLSRFETEIGAYARLFVEDGKLVYEIPDADLTQPATAVWTGNGDRGDLRDTANWTCRDLRRQVMAGALPTHATDVVVTGATSFNFPDAAAFDGGSLAVSGAVTLTADCDWRGLDFAQLAPGTTVDLNGHVLTLPPAVDEEAGAVSFTDSSAGTPGRLLTSVADGCVWNAERLTLSGNLRLVKAGAGLMTVSSNRCSFTGGEQAEGGRIIHVGAALAYEEFGAVGDGETDDMPAIVATHAYANRRGLPVRARDGATYYISGRDATAEVRTDVDFGTARFVIDDLQVENIRSQVFSVLSPQKAFSVRGVASLARRQRSLGVALPCPCVVRVDNANVKRYIRSGVNENAGQPQHEFLLVSADGDIDPRAPVVWDYETVTGATAYPIDERPLTIRGGVFKTIANVLGTESYCARGIGISRSNVRVEGLRHEVVEPTDGRRSSPYGGILSVQNCANVLVSNCTFTARKYFDLQGTYDLGANGAVGLSFVDCRQTNDINDAGNWGIFGSNYCKLLLYDRCSFSRFDAHQGVCNATIRNSEIGVKGINAIGFGTLLVENTTVYATSFINLRSDYGCCWEGEFVIRNCTFVPNAGKSATGVLIAGTYDDTHDHGYPCTMPWRITVDGLYVNDKTRPKGYAGPWLFSAFTASNTSEAHHAEYPYQVAERVIVTNYSSESGLPFRLSSNPWMFRDVVVDDRLPTDVAFAVGEPVSGWNWTNATVSVDVTQVDAPIADGRLVLEVTDASGRAVCTREQAVSEPGRFTFALDVPQGGAFYRYSVKAMDGDRDLAFATASGERDLLSGRLDDTLAPAFSAAVVGGEDVTVNGDWSAAPQVDAANGRYRVANRAAFEIGEPADPLKAIRTDVTYAFEDLIHLGDRPVEPDRVQFAAVCESTVGEEEFGRWMAVVPTADGAEWSPLYGAVPVTGVAYVVRFEQDRRTSPERIRYLVRPRDTAEFTALSDADGRIWLPSPLPAGQALTGVDFVGSQDLYGLNGRLMDAALAEVDGRRYDDLNAALAAGAAAGKPVNLLIDVAFEPEGASGPVWVNVAGKRFKWTDGKGAALVRDPSTGLFRLVPLAGGACANGLDSYTSFALGLDASDPQSKPLLSIVRQADGSFGLALNVRSPSEFSGCVSYQLESSADVSFEHASLGELTTEPVFRVDVGAAPARFFRAHVYLQD